MPSKKHHTVPVETIVSKLKTNITKGITRTEAERRLDRFGKNQFNPGVQHGIFHKIVQQLKSPLVIILLLAGIATFVLQEFIDATVIFIALVINVGIGTFQEERASKAFEKLSSSQVRHAMVIRDGKRQIIRAENLVPGDIVVLESGSHVPADLRLVDTEELSINEAPLTGEWLAVEKKEGQLSPNTPMSERVNMAWMGTLVVGGAGRGVVVATGGNTEIGSIAEELATAQDVRTPIQRKVARLAVFLSYLIAIVVIGIFVLGWLRGEPVREMLLLSIAVAVSVIPEGLPAAVTSVLAIGMEKILSRGGLVRNLLAAETLGSTTTILTDKTGTLTQAKMDVARIITAHEIVEGKENEADERMAFVAGVLASEAFVEEKEDGTLVVRGRPMEQALVRKGMEEGVSQEELRRKYTQSDFLSFESSLRFSGSLNVMPEGKQSRFFILGAPEQIIDTADKVFEDGEYKKMTDATRNKFASVLQEEAAKGMRIVAVAVRDVSWDTIPDFENEEEQIKKLLDDVGIIGLIAFEDPVREDVEKSIAKVKGAGAHIIMLTGDNRETAKYVAVKTGIARQGDSVLVGKEIDDMDDGTLLEQLEKTPVIARVTPKQKLRIVNLLRNEGEVVAMTGDGINDAPALQSADIGVAVGSGTEVAREASDLVLLDDSFTIIEGAIEEGRRIIDNLKKVITHLLSTSFHGVMVIGVAILFGLPLPILAVQILWVNILEEGLLSFGFAFEPAEKGLMERDPRSERIKEVLTSPIRKLIVIAGVVTGFFSIGLYLLLLSFELPIEEIRTIIFVVLSLDALFFAISLKHLRGPFWKVNVLNNKYLLFALGTSTTLLIATLATPILRTFLSLTVLTPIEVLLLVGVGLVNLLTIETTKYFVFKKERIDSRQQTR